MNPSLRKALGSVAILTYLSVYVVVAVTVGETIAGAPWWGLMLYYAIAGVAWAVPLRPLFRWMNA